MTTMDGIMQKISSESGPSRNYLFFYKQFVQVVKRIYVLFWHELSMDERVRRSPYHPPPENEVKMTLGAKIFFRSHRIVFLFTHVMAVISLYYCICGHVMMKTIMFSFQLAITMGQLWNFGMGVDVLLVCISQIGIVTGAHRLWSHNTFKATWPLRVFLMLCQTLTSQYSIYYWAQIHRIHHKFSDTPKDPHNSNRGLFFSHMGWIITQQSPEVREEMKKVWLEDLKNDKVVMFQKRYYVYLALAICWILPGLIPWYFWKESFFHSYSVSVILRFVIWLNMTSTVNSLSHLHGTKPFDKYIKPVDNRFAYFITLGDEGWHNYHHVFPWDYRTSDLWGYRHGISTVFIELCARLGWIYDLKTTPPDLSLKRRQRTGDLTCNTWGWNDANVNPMDRQVTKIHFQKKKSKNT